jgi:BMFP domain-containing protein YqiC
MQKDPVSALLQSIKSLLDQTLPKDLAQPISEEIESRLQAALKSLSLVPKQEFETQAKLLATLEAQIASLEKRLAQLEDASAADR